MVPAFIWSPAILLCTTSRLYDGPCLEVAPSINLDCFMDAYVARFASRTAGTRRKARRVLLLSPCSQMHGGVARQEEQGVGRL
jgi:hypothetical protein